MNFWDLLGPILLNAIEAAVEKGAFHEHTNVALITLIHKKGKNPQECASYRPISLINADMKLYSKMLVTRLESFMDKLIHPDQTDL